MRKIDGGDRVVKVAELLVVSETQTIERENRDEQPYDGVRIVGGRALEAAATFQERLDNLAETNPILAKKIGANILMLLESIEEPQESHVPLSTTANSYLTKLFGDVRPFRLTIDSVAPIMRSMSILAPRPITEITEQYLKLYIRGNSADQILEATGSAYGRTDVSQRIGVLRKEIIESPSYHPAIAVGVLVEELLDEQRGEINELSPGLFTLDSQTVAHVVQATNRTVIPKAVAMNPIEVDGPLAWMTDALCAQTDPDLQFPEKGASSKMPKKVCASCEVNLQCLEYALANDERYGMWGGLSERQRRKLRRARKVA
jgi:WhiB family redox-sensing transcriptional regulator